MQLNKEYDSETKWSVTAELLSTLFSTCNITSISISQSASNTGASSIGSMVFYDYNEGLSFKFDTLHSIAEPIMTVYIHILNGFG